MRRSISSPAGACFHALLIASLLFVGSCHQEPSRAADDTPPNRLNPEADFYGLLRRVHYSYIPFSSEEEMAAAAEVIVTGHPKDVAAGRTMGSPEGGNGHHTFVMAFTVNKTIKGQHSDVIYVQFRRSRPTTIEDLKARFPSGDDMRLYLVDLAKYPPKGEIFNDRAGLPDSTTIRYGLVGPQGMVVQTADGVVHPLVAENWIATGISW